MNGIGHIDLRALRFLVAVLERRSVTKAGEAMGLSQPASSRLLGQLRRALGDDPLIVRSRGGSVPTARAEELLPRLRAALAAAEHVFAPEHFDPASSTVTLRIATTDYGAAVVVTALARELAKHAPGISIDVCPWSSGTLDDLEEGRVDFGLYTDDPLPPGFKFQPLFKESYVCLVRRDHPVLRHRDSSGRVASAELAGFPRVLLRHPDGTGTDVEDVLAAHGQSPAAGIFVTPYFLNGPLLVAGSDHVLCMPRRVAEQVAGIAELHLIDFPEAEEFAYCMVWHDRSSDDPCLRWVRERVVSVLG